MDYLKEYWKERHNINILEKKRQITTQLARAIDEINEDHKWGKDSFASQSAYARLSALQITTEQLIELQTKKVRVE